MAPHKGTPSPFKGIMTDPIPRFWGKVRKLKDSECWDWVGWKNPEGYGYLCVNGKDTRAHRFSYELHKGEIPKGKLVCHSCDNPSCTNPEHLWLGTPKENMIDMRQKKRANDSGRARGEKSGNSKLTEQEVKELRKLFETGKYTKVSLGKRFGVSGRNVTDIVNHVTWPWLS